MSNVKCVEVVIFRSKKDSGGEGGRPGNGIALHLSFTRERQFSKENRGLDKGGTCMTTLRSAFPVRISYSVNVLSEPMLASTDDSLILKRTELIVSVDVGKVRFDTGALLKKISCVRSPCQASGRRAYFVSSHI